MYHWYQHLNVGIDFRSHVLASFTASPLYELGNYVFAPLKASPVYELVRCEAISSPRVDPMYRYKLIVAYIIRLNTMLYICWSRRRHNKPEHAESGKTYHTICHAMLNAKKTSSKQHCLRLAWVSGNSGSNTFFHIVKLHREAKWVKFQFRP